MQPSVEFSIKKIYYSFGILKNNKKAPILISVTYLFFLKIFKEIQINFSLTKLIL